MILGIRPTDVELLLLFFLCPSDGTILSRYLSVEKLIRTFLLIGEGMAELSDERLQKRTHLNLTQWSKAIGQRVLKHGKKINSLNIQMLDWDGKDGYDELFTLISSRQIKYCVYPYNYIGTCGTLVLPATENVTEDISTALRLNTFTPETRSFVFEVALSYTYGKITMRFPYEVEKNKILNRGILVNRMVKMLHEQDIHISIHCYIQLVMNPGGSECPISLECTRRSICYNPQD
jgi:hypothetical protein